MSDVASILINADQDNANTIFEAFQRAAEGANVATVWWAFAMIQAHILASAPDDTQLGVAERLAGLCAAALPGALIVSRQ